MHASEVTREVVERANELYWGSKKSVNKIADDLELSKGTLYAIVEPEPSGLGCPLCGDEVTYANRTAKDKKLLDCPTCDWDGQPDETIELRAEERSRPERSALQEPEAKAGRKAAPARKTNGVGLATDGPDPSGRTTAGSDDADATGKSPVHDPVDTPLPPRPFVPPPATTIAGGALLGAAVGLALVMWARRK